jgi:diaminohydroxyphosphoribosylaminopyrimidine deaminase/5-amino-6-(5-phosphoribosylamino)uracil reductase
MFDPDPRVIGQGIKKLRDNGVNVFGPVMRAECEYFNRGFVSVRTKSRPFITLKQARTKDGHLAKPDGSPLKITSKEQDIWSHTNLRFPADGIVCGVGTIMSDNPQLNTRLVQKNALQKEVPEPYRIILDPEGRIPLNSKVLTDGNQSRTMVIVSERAKKEVQAQISATSAMAIQCPVTGEEFDLPSLFQRIITPNGDYHGLTSLLIEGGKRTWESFKRSVMISSLMIV